MKLKQLWCSLFQVQHTVTLKQMKPAVDNAYENDSTEYRLRREKNNESVRKSRAKNRNKLQECQTHVQNLKNENIQLNKTLNTLETELFTLKGLFQHCFSVDLNKLSFKPSDIPTSTLYKIIMNKKTLKNSPNLPNAMNKLPITAAIGSSVKSDSSHHLVPRYSSIEDKYNETDKFYINQIKDALSNIVKTDANNNNSKTETSQEAKHLDLNTIQLVNDHTYSFKQNLTTN